MWRDYFTKGRIVGVDIAPKEGNVGERVFVERTNATVDESGATMSPDGTKMAWVKSTPAGSDLVISNPDGTAPVVAETRGPDCGFWDLDWQAT